jgi:hypothetical protein
MSHAGNGSNFYGCSQTKHAACGYCGGGIKTAAEFHHGDPVNPVIFSHLPTRFVIEPFF